ncbi:MAG: ribosome biogenesis GTPase Der [Candidatus Buchananbacteria bacterium]
MNLKPKIEKKLPTVVIVGRINAGKSSLFNRLTEGGKALVSDIPGTTRDYNKGKVSWRTKTFELIDTGGVDIDILKNSIQALLPEKKIKKLFFGKAIEKEIIKQTKAALIKADMVLMVVDGQAGLMQQDRELALVLKKFKKPIILACNKIDSPKWQASSHDFFKLGLGRPYAVSAANGSGTGDLLDELIKKIKGQRGRPKINDERPIKVAIIGKPNVGKSSLVNQILGEERVIVSEEPHTTREPQDTEIIYNDRKILIFDTAGLRKRAKIERGLEKMSTSRSLGLIKSADIILFITEVDKPITAQDSHLAGLIKDSGAGLILVGNKWDRLEEKTEKIDGQIRSYYQRAFPFLSFAPLVFISALTGRNVQNILDVVLAVDENRNRLVEENELEKIIKILVRRQRPVQAKGQKSPHIFAIKQVKTHPPEFVVSVNEEDTLHFSYLRFIENQIREKFDFLGVPVKIKLETFKH